LTELAGIHCGLRQISSAFSYFFEGWDRRHRGYIYI